MMVVIVMMIIVIVMTWRLAGCFFVICFLTMVMILMRFMGMKVIVMKVIVLGQNFIFAIEIVSLSSLPSGSEEKSKYNI